MAQKAMILALVWIATSEGPGTPASLPVVPGAVELLASTTKHGPRVEYDVREPFPAPEAILFLVQTLEKQGWKFQFGDLKLPRAGGQQPPQVAEESQEGTEAFWKELSAWKARRWDLPTPAPPWRGHWRNAAGEEIRYTLVYTCPTEHGMQCVYVHVCGALYSSEEAARRETQGERGAERCPTTR
jgi:hypothetical protein